MICDRCIHHKICCNEGVDDEALTYCADFFELVRCKDCNNSYIAEDGNRICTQDDYTGIIVTDNDYCSYGERRESKSTTEDDDPEVIKQRRIIEIRDEISKLYEELEKLTTIEHI